MRPVNWLMLYDPEPDSVKLLSVCPGAPLLGGGISANSFVASGCILFKGIILRPSGSAAVARVGSANCTRPVPSGLPVAGSKIGSVAARELKSPARKGAIGEV